MSAEFAFESPPGKTSFQPRDQNNSHLSPLFHIDSHPRACISFLLTYIHKRPGAACPFSYALNRAAGILTSHQTRFTNSVPLTPLLATLAETPGVGAPRKLFSRKPYAFLQFVPSLRGISSATCGVFPHRIFVKNRNVPALSRNAKPDCCDPPWYSPHSRGMYLTHGGCPHPSCGAAFVCFVYLYREPQEAATATITIFPNTLLLMETLLATRHNTRPAALSADSAEEPSAEHGGPSAAGMARPMRSLLPRNAG